MRYIFLFFISIFFHLTSSAQQYSIKGKVVDSIKKPIEFANVIIIDQNNKIVEGTITNMQGIFELKAKEGDYTLTISFFRL